MGGLAVVYILFTLLSLVGLIDWAHLEQLATNPWTGLLNPSTGPRMALLLGGLGIAYLVAGGLSYTLGRRRVRAVLGDGTIVIFRRLVAFAWIPVLVAAYLLTGINWESLHNDFQLHGSSYGLTLPVLVSMIIFGLTSLTLHPQLSRAYWGRLVGLVVSALPILVAITMVFALQRAIAYGSQPAPPSLLYVAVVQVALVSVEAYYVLVAGEAIHADWGEFTGARAHHLAAQGWLLLRMVARATILLAPVLIGLYFGLFYTPPAASVITDRQGQTLSVYWQYGEYRLPASAPDISPQMMQAIDAIEDPGVYTSPFTHSPVNPIRLTGVLNEGLQGLRGQGDISGASGLAAQIVKNRWGRPLTNLLSGLPAGQYLGNIATIVEKFAFEFPCGWALERGALLLGRERLVTMYLNEIEYGPCFVDGEMATEYPSAHGIALGALTFFNKKAIDLTLPESTLLAGLPQGPGRLNPWVNPNGAIERRTRVIEAMVREGYISQREADAAKSAPLGIADTPIEPPSRSPGFVRDLMDFLEAIGQSNVSNDGLYISTTLDSELQQDVEEAVPETVDVLRPNGVNDAAVVALDPRSGEVLAWYAGMRTESGDNTMPSLVTKFSQQPGSSLKPLVFGCALERGLLKPNDWLDDTQRTIDGEYIANWDNDSRGLQPWKEELAASRNTAAAYLVSLLTPRECADCLRDVFQVSTDLYDQVPTVRIGLGLAEMPMLELARAYTILANGGMDVSPTALLEVRSRDHQVLYQAQPAVGRRVLSCATADLVTQALVMASDELDLTNGLAAKTGTVSSSAYTVGYGPDIVLAAWVGRTEPGQGRLAIPREVLGKDGGGAIWKAIAEKRYAGQRTVTFDLCPE